MSYLHTTTDASADVWGTKFIKNLKTIVTVFTRISSLGCLFGLPETTTGHKTLEYVYSTTPALEYLQTIYLQFHPELKELNGRYMSIIVSLVEC